MLQAPLFDGMGWVVVGNWNDIFPPARKDCFRLHYIYISPIFPETSSSYRKKWGGVEDELLCGECEHVGIYARVRFHSSSWILYGTFWGLSVLLGFLELPTMTRNRASWSYNRFRSPHCIKKWGLCSQSCRFSVASSMADRFSPEMLISIFFLCS